MVSSAPSRVSPRPPGLLSPHSPPSDSPPSPQVPGHTALLQASLWGRLPTTARLPSKVGGPTRPESGQAALDGGPSATTRGFARELSVPSHYSAPRGTSGTRPAQASVSVCSSEGEGAPWPPDAAVCWASSVISTGGGVGGGRRRQPWRRQEGVHDSPGRVSSCASALYSHTPCALPPRQSHRAPHTHPYKEVCISLRNGWGRGVAQQMAGRLQVCLAGKGRRPGILIGGP